MHEAAYRAVEELVILHSLVDKKMIGLDLGGQYVNGSCRDLFNEVEWTGLDIVPGPGIDIVADGTSWIPDKSYDLVLCTEVLEHVKDWPAIIATAHKALRDGGILILTCASIGREPHSSVGHVPVPVDEHYGNVSLDEALAVAGPVFSRVDLTYNEEAKDLYMFAVK